MRSRYYFIHSYSSIFTTFLNSMRENDKKKLKAPLTKRFKLFDQPTSNGIPPSVSSSKNKSHYPGKNELLRRTQSYRSHYATHSRQLGITGTPPGARGPRKQYFNWPTSTSAARSGPLASWPGISRTVGRARRRAPPPLCSRGCARPTTGQFLCSRTSTPSCWPRLPAIAISFYILKYRRRH